MDYSVQKNIIFLSTPSEEVSARMLERLGVLAYKIGSNDLVTTPMLEEIAAWHKPTILSTGMATPDEIEETLDVFKEAGNKDVVILHCTSSYPTPPQDLNLRAIETLQKTFGCLVGFSDHSAGVAAAPLAVMLGAAVVETHITFDKTLPGPDHSMSLNPSEFAQLVATIRRAEGVPKESRAAEISKIPSAEIMLGNPDKKPTEAELAMRTPTRKSIVARRTIKAGETIDPSMLAYKRPQGGMPARLYKSVLGKKATVDIVEDEYILEEMLA
jgi:sialic acid synthase SpsE